MMMIKRKVRWDVEIIAPSVVALATGVVYSRCLGNGFVIWDDDFNFLSNYRFRGFSWANLRWIFAPSATYEPMRRLLQTSTYVFWGMSPLGYHLVSVLIHVAVAVFLYATILLLLPPIALQRRKNSKAVVCASSAIGTLLYSLHPLRVEPVAWASGQHHALGSLFALVSVFAYLRSKPSPLSSRRWRMLSIGAFALCMLSGPVGVTLPVTLLIIDAYLSQRDGRFGWLEFGKAIAAKTPFFIVAFLAAAMTISGRAATGFVEIARHGVCARFAQAAYGLTFYLRQSIAPWGLSPLYALPDRIDPLAEPFLASAIVVASISGAVFILRRRLPACLTVWCYYIVALTPVLGFVQFGSQIAADRYSYFASFGFAALAAGALMQVWLVYGSLAWRSVVGAAIVVSALLCGMTWRQIDVWHDSENLWRRALVLDPRNPIALNNLGMALAQKGEMGEAIRNYDLSRQSNPFYVAPENNLTVLLAGQGRLSEASQHADRALKLDPENVDAQINMGAILAKQGKVKEAIERYRRALEKSPDSPKAHYDLAEALGGLGDVQGEMQEYQAAIRFKPDYSEAYNNLGIVYHEQGMEAAALRSFAQAVETDPDNKPARENLATMFAVMKSSR